MQLLRFTFENHRSFLDEATLDLTRASLKTLKLPEGTSWTHHIHHADGIYGANASGKTNVLDALHYALGAIGSSATSWLDYPQFPRAPFALTADATVAPTTIELEFIHDNRRYQYRFVADADGIIEESLRVVVVRWKSIFTRSRSGQVNGLFGRPRVARRELALSRIAQLGDPTIQPIWEAIQEGFDIYRVGDHEVNKRLDHIARRLIERSVSLDELVTLAQIADTGITHIEVEERALPPGLAKLMRALKPASNESEESEKSEACNMTTRNDEQLSDLIAHNLLFRHGRDSEKFGESDESTGTMAWLALGTAVFDALKAGRVLVVDELGASLHPQLSHLIIDWFEDPTINTKGAQLIFTSHDIALLDSGRGDREKREQVWFVEKGGNGTSELFNLSDFPLQSRSNIVKQYLEGRFGAIPYTVPSLIHSLLKTSSVNQG